VAAGERVVPHVLIPLDGSALAEAVIPVASSLRPTQVTFLHVHEGPEPPAALEAMFTSARGHASLPAERCAAIVRQGRPAEAILAAANEVGASLVALSTHGRTGFNRLVLGSVAEEVVRAAPAPVLLVRAGSPAPARPVLERPLVGYDGSDKAWRAVEALALLGRDRVGVVDLLGVHDVAPLRGPPDPLLERLVALQRDALLEQVQRAGERARPLGLEARPSVREGRPSSVLLETAEELGSTVVVVATHGRTVLTRWIFGSVAEELLHTSTLPLLIAR
jgi:nucleotide-binding universal stress UspA family protein